MIKFICQDNNVIFININDLPNYENLQDADSFVKIFSNENLEKYSDISGNNDILKVLKISSIEWLEMISFIKNGEPMYYSLNVFNDPSKKESFIYNLERLNIAFNKLGGLNKFDEFYKNFNNNAKNYVSDIYNPQEPTRDFKHQYQWGLGNLTGYAITNSTYAKFGTADGWSSCKIFNKKNEIFVWFRRLKDNFPSTEEV